MDERHIKAHDASIYNRKTLENSQLCGCFHCVRIYSPKEIKDWADNDDTALCPYCRIDSVIGERSGFPITKEFLSEMRDYWF